MSLKIYAEFEQSPGIDPFHLSYSIDPIKNYYLRCYCKQCDFQIMGYCTCLNGHCFPEENNAKFDLRSRTIVSVT